MRALIEFLDALEKSLGERYADCFSNDRNSKERSRSVQENSPSTSAKEPKLLDQLRHKMRMLHVAKRTEEAYIAWIYRYLCFARDRMRTPKYTLAG
ncbi:MAG: phage integrase N-terminal SAM-like domain-containing protein [Pirellulaceae bacterium]